MCGANIKGIYLGNYKIRAVKWYGAIAYGKKKNKLWIFMLVSCENKQLSVDNNE